MHSPSLLVVPLSQLKRGYWINNDTNIFTFIQSPPTTHRHFFIYLYFSQKEISFIQTLISLLFSQAESPAGPAILVGLSIPSSWLANREAVCRVRCLLSQMWIPSGILQMGRGKTNPKQEYNLFNTQTLMQLAVLILRDAEVLGLSSLLHRFKGLHVASTWPVLWYTFIKAMA